MLRRVLLALVALAFASAAQGQPYRPGYAPGFRPGFQFLGAPLAIYDFAGGSYPAVSVSRASTGYVADLAGAYSSVAADTLRRSNLGALIEPAATNGNRNSSMQGAVPGTPGTRPNLWTTIWTPAGVTSSIVSLTTVNGVEGMVVRWQGTATNAGDNIGFAFETAGGVPAAQGQTFVPSAFFQIVAGSGANLTNPRLSLLEFNSSNAFLTNQDRSITAPSASFARASGTATTTNAATASVRSDFFWTPITGQPIDISLFVGLPGLERDRLTSPIRTTNAAVTRAADAASITIPAGASRISYTFDDGSTQQVSVSPGAYAIPTGLNRPYIARATVLP